MVIVISGILLLAFIYDTDGTARLVATALSVRGTTWIVKKVTENINVDASQIIDFTGWSIAGISMVRVLGNAMGSINKVTAFVDKTAVMLDKIATIVDKITFWN